MDSKSPFVSTAKTIFYNSNGSGRDSYILTNHGGMVAPRLPNIQPENGSMNCKEIHMRTISPTIHSKPVHYASDGTGRDSYIVRSSGGFFQGYQPGSSKQSFYTNLRSYEPGKACFNQRRRSLSPSQKEKKDVFLNSQTHWNSSTMSTIQKFKNYQKTADKRLSIPKYTSIKKIFIKA